MSYLYVFYTIFKSFPLLQTSPALNPVDEVGKLAKFKVPLSTVATILGFPIVTVLLPFPTA
jgi:hypothetical protein